MLFFVRAEHSSPGPWELRGAASLRTLVCLWGDGSLQLHTTSFSLPAPSRPPSSPTALPSAPDTAGERLRLWFWGRLTSVSAGQAAPHPSPLPCRSLTAAVLGCPRLLETPTQAPFPTAAVGFNPWRTEFIERLCSPPHPGHILPNI